MHSLKSELDMSFASGNSHDVLGDRTGDLDGSPHARALIERGDYNHGLRSRNSATVYAVAVAMAIYPREERALAVLGTHSKGFLLSAD